MLPIEVAAKDVLPGPVKAKVVSVYDGDTFKAEAHIWLDQYVTVNVRVVGADTPELRGKCQREIDLAVMARDRAIVLMGEDVTLSNISHDKYGGRVDATVTIHDGRDLAAVLIEDDLARPYLGERRQSWCE